MVSYSAVYGEDEPYMYSLYTHCASVALWLIMSYIRAKFTFQYLAKYDSLEYTIKRSKILYNSLILYIRTLNLNVSVPLPQFNILLPPSFLRHFIS